MEEKISYLVEILSIFEKLQNFFQKAGLNEPQFFMKINVQQYEIFLKQIHEFQTEFFKYVQNEIQANEVNKLKNQKIYCEDVKYKMELLQFEYQNQINIEMNRNFILNEEREQKLKDLREKSQQLSTQQKEELQNQINQYIQQLQQSENELKKLQNELEQLRKGHQ
ncbi:hypothetical protein PPERSA_10550 [Pseudocohnilembus persalinus]|uniref:Uncharacterized protein n=1 Tax=Pseudocohnilembus persalinus TaxID=266149 RepID=A0A0V0QLF5_PSEPJ|nr:hypothetical protein PPERSA_10550 [Pseudocohnilembus persalinus]|eukprot:KRX03177.1 hypothetical protein PPERSA_10550 [Pseudocohnilembus persalinus]